MTLHVTLRQIRILMDHSTSPAHPPSLKICINQQIYKYHDIVWNTLCHRWQLTSDVKLQISQLQTMELELYTKKYKNMEIMGESRIEMGRLAVNFGGQFKNCLLLDGKVVGWFYCDIQLGAERQRIQPKYLYIHKLTLDLLQLHNNGTINILLNQQKLTSKQFTLNSKKRILFPNVRTQVKKSDCLVMKLNIEEMEVMPLRFVLDQIKCGETTNMSVWIRNRSKIKIGQLEIEYFLDSVHFRNENKEAIEKYCQPKGSLLSLSITKASHGKVSIMTRKDSLLNKNTKHLDPNNQNNMLKKSILSFTNIKSNTSKSNKSEDMISSLNTSLMSSHFPKIL